MLFKLDDNLNTFKFSWSHVSESINWLDMFNFIKLVSFIPLSIFFTSQPSISRRFNLRLIILPSINWICLLSLNFWFLFWILSKLHFLFEQTLISWWIFFDFVLLTILFWLFSFSLQLDYNLNTKFFISSKYSLS